MSVTGFDVELLGKPSHDSLIKLQEYELKLMEVIKKTVTARMKCDRDYAQALLNVASTGGKIEAPAHFSPMYNVWQELIRCTSTFGQAVRTHAEQLQTSTIDKIANLIKDKQSLKKSYAEQRDRLDNQLLQIIYTELEKKRNYYVKYEQEASNAKRAYDSSVDRGKMKDIEKCQDKYKKGTMKLHQNHNEYVLHLTEASHHQQYYRTALLPELLGNLYYMQTESVEVLRNILLEFVSATSPCTEEIVCNHREAVNKITALNPDEEYIDFIEAKRSPLENEANIQFDTNLLRNESLNLPEGQLVLNSLSIQGIEHACNGFQEDLETVQERLNQDRASLNALHEEIQQISDNLGDLRRNFSDTHIGLLQKKMEYTTLKLQLVENDVSVKKLQEQYSITSNCLQELGDKSPPLGLNLPTLDSMSAGEPRSPVNKGGSMRPSGLIKHLKQLTNKTHEDAKPKIFDHSKDVRDQDWFHGMISRIEANGLLSNEGEFLLRESSNAPGELVLSAFSGKKQKHFKVQNVQNRFKFEVEIHDTIVGLIEAHYNKGIYITKSSGCLITKPVVKDKWSLNHTDLEMGDRLGRGNFGDVFRAHLKSDNIDVAVKTCRESVDQRTRDKFLMEAKILKGYDHPNIVRLIGVCTEKQPVYIVMELVTGGDLGKFLKKKINTLTSKELIKMCLDACSGLNYLEEKKCIHRDVAARNCLVTDSGVVKITDFGMSREEEDGVYSVSGGMKQIPIKWTAPEAMNYGTYTHASDVWSFGILVWEIFSFGKVPYPGLTNQQAREHIEYERRMDNPDGCPERMYTEVMLRCWEKDPQRRPRFYELLKSIKSIKC